MTEPDGRRTGGDGRFRCRTVSLSASQEPDLGRCCPATVSCVNRLGSKISAFLGVPWLIDRMEGVEDGNRLCTGLRTVAAHPEPVAEVGDPHAACSDARGCPRSLRRRKVAQDTQAGVGRMDGYECRDTAVSAWGTGSRRKTPKPCFTGEQAPCQKRLQTLDVQRQTHPHIARSGCKRLTFNARHTKSPCALSRPRTLNRLKPRTSFIQPLGASDSHLRCA